MALSPRVKATSIYSGSAVIDVNNTSGFFPDQDDGVVAIYTLHSDEIEDCLLPGRFFWYEDHWVKVVSYAADNIAGVFTSPDLKNWTSTSNININHGTKLECPNLVKLPVRDDHPDDQVGGRGKVIGHKYTLAFGSGSKGSPYNGSTIHYYIGDFDGETFTPDEVGKIRRLKMVVDRSIADISDADGKHAGTMLYFATKPLAHLKVETIDLAEESQVEAELWSLSSIWE